MKIMLYAQVKIHQRSLIYNSRDYNCSYYKIQLSMIIKDMVIVWYKHYVYTSDRGLKQDTIDK